MNIRYRPQVLSFDWNGRHCVKFRCSYVVDTSGMVWLLAQDVAELLFSDVHQTTKGSSCDSLLRNLSESDKCSLTTIREEGKRGRKDARFISVRGLALYFPMMQRPSMRGRLLLQAAFDLEDRVSDFISKRKAA